MQFRWIAAVAVVAFAFSSQVLACGDSLYRVGTGVSYRVYTAPLPGNVLVYGQSEGAKQLAAELAKSGHGVHLVQNEADLASEMEKGGYDVVIAPYSEHVAVEARQGGSGVEFIPVAQSAEEEKAAMQSYDRVLVANDAEIKHYLKAIHKALKSKA